MDRPLYVYVLIVVGVFVVVGTGIGLSINFTLGFFIEQFVEPGDDPLDSTQVGLMFLVAIFFIYAVSPFLACIVGVGIGRAFPDRETVAGGIAGVGSFIGFFLFVGLGLFFTFAVLAEYGMPAGGGDGNGGGSPLDQTALLTLMLQVSIPVGLVGLVTAYLTSWLDRATVS